MQCSHYIKCEHFPPIYLSYPQLMWLETSSLTSVACIPLFELQQLQLIGCSCGLRGRRIEGRITYRVTFTLEQFLDGNNLYSFLMNGYHCCSNIMCFLTHHHHTVMYSNLHLTDKQVQNLRSRSDKFSHLLPLASATTAWCQDFHQGLTIMVAGGD